MSTFDRVNELSSKSVERPRHAQVSWEDLFPPHHWEAHYRQENRDESGLEELRQKIKKINSATARCPEEERAKFTMDLLTLWRKRFNDGSKEEAEKVFGTFYDYAGTRTIATLTADGAQFRIWHGFPACLGVDHVDSCGKGLLFGVYGHPDVVAEYVKAYLPDLSKCARGTGFEIKVPNGDTLYMTYSHWR